MASTIYLKIKRKLTWEIIENHDHITRMQGAKTSKAMLPCERPVYLHKLVRSKTIFEQIAQNHKNNAKNDPKKVDKNNLKTSKNDAGKHRKISPKYSKLSNCVSYVGTFC